MYQLVGRCLRRESPECGGSLLSSAVVLNWVPSSPHPVLKQQAPHLYEQRGKNTFSKMENCGSIALKIYLIRGGIHISSKTSNHGSIVFDEIEIEAFETFGTFQLNFAHQHAPGIPK